MTTEITTVDTGPEEQRIVSTREAEERTLTPAETQEQAVEESVEATTPTVESDIQTSIEPSTRTPDRIGGVTEPEVGVSGFRVGVTDHEPSQWKTRAGLPAENRDIQQFIDKSETYQFHRTMSISDDRALDEQAAGEATRDVMSEHFENVPSQDYLYSVDTTDGTQVDVVMTGEREQMWADRQRLEEFHELSRSAYDQAEGLDQELQDELTREHIEEMDQWREQVNHEYDIGVGHTTEPERGIGR